MDMILIGGLWLTTSEWDATLPWLEALGHRGIPVALPGLDDGDPSATYEDQVAAVLAAVDAADRPLVVGHSAAATLAWVAADQRPDRIAGVALVGGMPSSDGEAYADFFEPVDGVMPFPGWEKFAGPDSDDLTEEQRSALERAMVPVPAGVTKGTVRLGDDRRHAVPAVLVCPEFTPDQAREWLASGDMPELERSQALHYVDLVTGHWPMTSDPAALARSLAEAARLVAG